MFKKKKMERQKKQKNSVPFGTTRWGSPILDEKKKEGSSVSAKDRGLFWIDLDNPVKLGKTR